MEFLGPGEKLIYEMKAPEPKSADEGYMLRALRIAELGRGRVSPNPLVGAVLVKNGVIVGEGYHAFAGGPHAEVVAIEMAGSMAEGAILYVTLEPCNHHGKTPPCTQAIAKARVKKVVYSTEDTNPDVTGGGSRVLKSAGVEVVRGPFSEIARRQNESYFKSVETGFPFVTLKMGLSLDGKVATGAGKSKWITSKHSRDDVQRMRMENDAIMVGIGTVLADDPLLTPRTSDARGSCPLRVVLDSNCRIPPESRILNEGESPALVVVSKSAPRERIEAIKRRGAEVIIAGVGNRVDLKELMKALSLRGVRSVLLEGGPTVASSFLKEGLIDKMVFFVAPIVLGGHGAPGPFAGEGVKDLTEAWRFRIETVFQSGNDLKIIAYPEDVG